MDLKNTTQIPLPKALALIFISVILVSGTAAIAIYYFFSFRSALSEDPRYNIVAIVQYCHNKEWLKTAILAELLELSIDSPTNLYRFNTAEARQKLLDLPIFKSVEIKKIKPATVYVEYALRQPVAYLGDFTNTAIDDLGSIIPFKPYYTPKNIPQLFAGLSSGFSSDPWKNSLNEPKASLAFFLLDLLKMHFSGDGCLVRSIDISRAFEHSCGQQEIVISLDERVEYTDQKNSYLVICPRTLRLPVDYYSEQLANYLVLRKMLNARVREERPYTPQKPPVIIDMRIPKLAFF